MLISLLRKQPTRDSHVTYCHCLETFKIHTLKSPWHVESKTRFKQNDAGAGNNLAVFV